MNRQMQSQLRISPHQRPQVWDTASWSLCGTAVSGQERGAPTRRHPGAPAWGLSCSRELCTHLGPQTQLGQARSMGSCLLGRDHDGTLALPSPGLKDESESIKEPRGVTGG